MTGNRPVGGIVSQHAPNAHPPSPTFNDYSVVQCPVIVLGHLVQLAHALQSIHTRDEQRRPRHKTIPRNPDGHTIRGDVVNLEPVLERARR